MNKAAIADRGYQIKEEIGAGGFSIVYRAFQPDAGRDVAVKIIQLKTADAPNQS